MKIPLPIILRNGVIWAMIHILTNVIFFSLKIGFNLTAFICITLIGTGLMAHVGIRTVKKIENVRYKDLLLASWLTTFFYTLLYVLYYYYAVVIRDSFDKVGILFYIFNWVKGSIFFLIISSIVSLVIYKFYTGKKATP